jgi:hypothetical protein
MYCITQLIAKIAKIAKIEMHGCVEPLSTSHRSGHSNDSRSQLVSDRGEEFADAAVEPGNVHATNNANLRSVAISVR